MKKRTRTFTALLLTVSMTATVAAASVPTVSAASDNHSVELSFSGNLDLFGNRSVLEQYVTRDTGAVKLLNGRTLYRYDTVRDTFDVEFTFPQQQDINPTAAAGSYTVFPGVTSAYVNEHTGLLYYAFDKYRKINDTPENMVVEVVTYDLEKGGVVSTRDYAGENLSAVGADDNGNVFLAVRRQVSELSNDTALYVVDASGQKQAKLLLDDPIDTFCGSVDSGKFYFAETLYEPAGDNQYYISRQLGSGSYSDGALTVSSDAVAQLEPRYNRPAAVTDGYLVTYATRVYDVNTDSAMIYAPGVSSKGGDFYNRFCTPNAIVTDGKVYTLQSSRNILCSSLDDGTVAASYQADFDIVSVKPCGDGVLALVKDGTRYSYRQIPFNAFAVMDVRTFNLNDLSVYQRTQADIVQRFAQAVPQDYSAPFFAATGSAQAPYQEYTLTDETKQNAVRAANYFRWLEGLTELQSAEETVWDNDAKGAVLTEKNVRVTGGLSHNPAKPEDMDDAFYQAALASTSSSNIAFGYGSGQRAILSLLRGFLNDEGHLIPGHRDTFMCRNGVAFAAGYSEYAGVNTIPFVNDPNPMGKSAIGNDQPAYAWPAPGYFPTDEISTVAMWTINLNTDVVNLSQKPFAVTITDLTTGERFVRDSADNGLYTTEAWGKFIVFQPPKTQSYDGKRYRVEVVNLSGADGAAVTLEYTVNFFDYSDPVEIDGTYYAADSYGRLTVAEPAYVLGDVDGDGDVTISDVTNIQRYGAELMQLDARALAAADIDGDGMVTINDATYVQRYLAELNVPYPIGEGVYT